MILCLALLNVLNIFFKPLSDSVQYSLANLVVYGSGLGWSSVRSLR